MSHKTFMRLEKKIERNERTAHPNYPQSRIHYIAQAKAGEIARMHHFKKRR
jgi:hypothetical protein